MKIYIETYGCTANRNDESIIKGLLTKNNYDIVKDTKEADIIITATSHPSTLLNSNHVKKNAIIVDVSQPSNISKDVCAQRNDICRVDGGFVDFPIKYNFQIPGIPIGKMFSCIVEVIMQTKEDEKRNHVGSIDLKHLRKTEEWAKKYGYQFQELTNFGEKIL